jgi:hypothetical protein
MKQRAHAWTALRALKLLDDSRKVPKLVEFYYHTTCLMSEKGLGAFEWLKEQSEIKVIPKVSPMICVLAEAARSTKSVAECILKYFWMPH